MSRRSSSILWCAMLMLTAAAVVVPGVAIGSPARRLARRGVVVVPPPPGAIVVPSAPIVIAPRPLRRLGVPPGVMVVPGLPRDAAVGAEPVLALSPGRISAGLAASPSSVAALKAPASASPATPPPAAGFKPAPASPAAGAVEEIPAPPAATGTTVGGAAAAFTAEWYARHPDAWRPVRPPASWWRIADAASVTGWIGEPVSRTGGAADSGQVVKAGGEQPGVDGLRSVLVLQSGHGPEAAGADWLPLGVFAVVPPGGGSAHNYQQLAVDRSGAIRGNFYDALSDTVLPITGSVDRTTLRAAWIVGANGSRFEAAVAAFAAPPRTVVVTSGGGSRDLELVPIDGP